MASKVKVESDAYGQFLGRCIRALPRRASEGDLATLSEIVALQAQLDQALVAAARALHAGGDGWHGFSYTDIAAQLGVSRQAARQRFDDLDG